MRDDLLHLVVLERLNVLLGQHLKQILVPQTPGRIPSTGLLLPQNGKTHPGGLQNFHEGFGDWLFRSTKAPVPPTPKRYSASRLTSSKGTSKPSVPPSR